MIPPGSATGVQVEFIAQAAWGDAPLPKSSAVWGKSVYNWQREPVARHLPVSPFQAGAR